MSRPRGALNKSTRDALRKAKGGKFEGIDVIAFLLNIIGDRERPIELRLDAAKAAAPYLHPKLSNVEMSVKSSTYADDILKLQQAQLKSEPDQPTEQPITQH